MAIGNNYEYGLVDFSYVLSRNLYAASKDKKVGEYDEGDIIRITIQTINKLARDYNINCEKIVFLADRWDKNIGGYIRHYILKDYVDYKGTRKWMTEELLESMRNDPTVTPEQIEKAEIELYQNQVKRKAKAAITKEFKNLGMPVLGVDGYEADDLAYIASCCLYNENRQKKSILITKDSDQLYALSPIVSYFKLPTMGSTPKVITYEEMYETIPEPLKQRDVSLYEYNAYMNSLGFSHNDNKKTIKSGVEPVNAIIHILDGDYSDLIPGKLDTFLIQMKSFDVNSFPRIQEAVDLIYNHLESDGIIGNLDTFHTFCDKYHITGISDKYFSDFISRFDERLYSKKL